MRGFTPAHYFIFSAVSPCHQRPGVLLRKFHKGTLKPVLRVPSRIRARSRTICSGEHRIASWRGSGKAGWQRQLIIPRSAPLRAVKTASWPTHSVRGKPLVSQGIKPVPERASHTFRMEPAQYRRRLAEWGSSRPDNALCLAVKILGFLWFCPVHAVATGDPFLLRQFVSRKIAANRSTTSRKPLATDRPYLRGHDNWVMYDGRLRTHDEIDDEMLLAPPFRQRDQDRGSFMGHRSSPRANYKALQCSE